jgi:hypothetical protein
MSLLVLSAVMSLAAAAADTPAPAADDAPPPSDAQMKAAEQKADKDRVVCRREIPVGSHRPVKTCLTKGQWKEWEDMNKDKLNNQTLQDPTPGVSSAQ